ncbi:MAG: hypothetical protein ACREIC_01505, partial [Limisphaerales bacterium]
VMFLPSGRVHAICAGLVIFEIQQNSDTTYRVFDWNRTGLDGKPRALHVRESLQSIDFQDFEPDLVRASKTIEGAVTVRQLVRDPLFDIDSIELRSGSDHALEPGKLHVLGTVSGELRVSSPAGAASLSAGQFCLVPAALTDVHLRAHAAATVLRTSLGAWTAL